MSATLLAHGRPLASLLAALVVVFWQVAVGWPVPWAEVGYVTDHPVRPDRAGLASRHGWFSIQALDAGCDLIEVYSNVVVTPTTDGQVVTLTNAAGDTCTARIRLLAWQSCQTDEAGECSAPPPP